MAHQRMLKVVPWINPNALAIKGKKFRKVREFDSEIILKHYKKELDALIPKLKAHPALLAWYVFDEPSKDLILEGVTRLLVAGVLLKTSCPTWARFGRIAGQIPTRRRFRQSFHFFLRDIVG